MRILILYKSKNGSTKDYAEYIKSKTQSSEVFSIEDFDISKLPDYDLVAIGSGTYAGKMEGVTFLSTNWDVLKTKKIYFFGVGAIPTEKIESIQSYNQIPEEIRNSIFYIKLPGRLHSSKQNVLMRFIIKIALLLKAPIEDNFDLKRSDILIEKIRKESY